MQANLDDFISEIENQKQSIKRLDGEIKKLNTDFSRNTSILQSGSDTSKVQGGAQDLKELKGRVDELRSVLQIRRDV
jgi:hypothetical protein